MRKPAPLMRVSPEFFNWAKQEAANLGLSGITFTKTIPYREKKIKKILEGE